MVNEPLAEQEIDVRRHLERLTEIGIALTSERSLERLLDRILYEARDFTNAEAGTLYVREGPWLRFAVVQNDRLAERAVASEQARIPISQRSIAGYVAATGSCLNIRDAESLPAEAAYRFDDSFDKSTGFQTHSMLVLPLLEPSGDINGVIQLINARDTESAEVVSFEPAIESLCRSLASQAGVALRNAKLTKDLEQSYQETVYRLARAAEYRDADTGQHVRRVSLYARELALAVGLSEQEAHLLMLASPMHDVGKVAVPDAILQKAGPLTDEEWLQMKRHTVLGGEILEGSDVPLLQLSRVIALTHHERWDGQGYPEGLRGEEIPLAGRIIAVVDVFDALTSERCYKEPMALERACGLLRREAGAHFDASIVDSFFGIFDTITQIRDRFPDRAGAAAGL